MKNIYKAIANFKAECPVIFKDTSGHNYKYADLPKITEVITPILQKYNLEFIQPLTYITAGDKIVPAIKTIIFETETGESIEDIHPITEFELKKITQTKKDKDGNQTQVEKYVVGGMEQMSLPQAQGSMVTYFRRYALSSMLGLITDKDTDASGGNSAVDDLDL
jgi:predicted transcriptional regulator